MCYALSEHIIAPAGTAHRDSIAQTTRASMDWELGDVVVREYATW
jgi:hypothetical protein